MRLTRLYDGHRSSQPGGLSSDRQFGVGDDGFEFGVVDERQLDAEREQKQRASEQAKRPVSSQPRGGLQARSQVSEPVSQPRARELARHTASQSAI